MIKKLTLENFKNFKNAELELGPFTLLVGANATGKSNIREAFRFLHGIGRGYSIPEIIGEKYSAGERVWDGIRGGLTELVYHKENAFRLGLEYKTPNGILLYEVESDLSTQFPKIISESLYLDELRLFAFSNQEKKARHESKPNFISVPVGPISKLALSIDAFQKPILTQLQNYEIEHDVDKFLAREHPFQTHRFMMSRAGKYIPEFSEIIRTNNIDREKLKQDYDFGESQFALFEKDIQARKELASQRNKLVSSLQSMRFLDFSPLAMRSPSFPGQTHLGDRGENLSSVLQAICQSESREQLLLEWVRELTPMDAINLKFVPDQVGRILLTLVESDGYEISAYSASDGTLRLLGVLAALLGPNPSQLYFFEEIENGIHPSRLHLLLDLIEQVTNEREIQIIATTHSPQLLGLVSEQSLKNASLTYRLEEKPDAHIQRIMDIPNAREIFKTDDLSTLYERGWLENSVHFLKNGKEPA